MDSKIFRLTTDYNERGPFGPIGKALNDIGRLLNGLHFADGGSVLTTSQFIRLRSATQTAVVTRQQFECIVGPTTLGVPSVSVYGGYHMTPYGAFGWSLASPTDISITGAGWVITRQAKSGPGAVTVVFQATQANPASTTHYETDVCYVAYDAGTISLSLANFGERNLVATV